LLVSGNTNGNVSLFHISPKAPSLIEVKNDEPRPIRGTVRNASMTPIAGAGVLLLQSGDTLASTSTDQAGKFAFDPVDPGTYQLRVVDQTYGVNNFTIPVSTHDVDTNLVVQ